MFEKIQESVSLLDGIIAVILGIATMVGFFFKKKRKQKTDSPQKNSTVVSAKNGVAAGRDIKNNTITINNRQEKSDDG